MCPGLWALSRHSHSGSSCQLLRRLDSQGPLCRRLDTASACFVLLHLSYQLSKLWLLCFLQVLLVLPKVESQQALPHQEPPSAITYPSACDGTSLLHKNSVKRSPPQAKGPGGGFCWKEVVGCQLRHVIAAQYIVELQQLRMPVVSKRHKRMAAA